MILQIYGTKEIGFSASGEHEPGIDPALRHCPFCGSSDIELSNTHTPCYTAKCGNCEAEGSDGRMMIDHKLVRQMQRMPMKSMSRKRVKEIHEIAFKAGIDAWNCRVPFQSDR